ncbi:integrase [Rhodococcus sp. NPDC058514]|uniref:integrase n=1 Tax=Rhodococcus sp. NPDC058514 TaxID=3346532 RepID=UPI00364B1658
MPAELETLPADDAASSALAVPADAAAAMHRLRVESVSPNTRAAQMSDWKNFTRWCDRVGRNPIPASPDLVGWFLTEKSSEVRQDGRPAYASATMTRWVASINKIHSLAGHPKPGQSPTVREILRGIARTRATPPVRREPLLTDDIRTIVESMRDRSAKGSWADRAAERRDSALLLIGLTGAMRRSELSALAVGDVVPHRADGLYVTIRRSKTDQAAAGRTVTLPYGSAEITCPVCAYWRWREVLDVWDRDGKPAVRELLSAAAHETHPHPGRGGGGGGGAGTGAGTGRAARAREHGVDDVGKRSEQAVDVTGVGHVSSFIAMCGVHYRGAESQRSRWLETNRAGAASPREGWRRAERM